MLCCLSSYRWVTGNDLLLLLFGIARQRVGLVSSLGIVPRVCTILNRPILLLSKGISSTATIGRTLKALL